MQAIRTRYFGPTNVRDSRMQAKCEAGAIYVSYDRALNIDENHKAAMTSLQIKLDWNTHHYEPMVGGSFNGDMYWVFGRSNKS